MTAPPAPGSLDAAARAILERNDRGGYTVPTHGLYPYQWNWDSAFVALGFATFDLDRAWREIETLLGGQWANGMVPHILFHTDEPTYFPGPSVWQCTPELTGAPMATSGISNPPVAASSVRHLWQRGGGRPDDPRLRALFPKLLAWSRWYRRYRDPLGNGLALVTHNWETGRDNNPEWDDALAAVDTSRVQPYQRRDTGHVNPALRPTQAEYDRYVAIVEFGRERRWDAALIGRENPFRMIDVGNSMMLLRADRDLLVMAEALGDTAAADELRAQIARSEAGVDWLWNEAAGAFCSRDVITGASTGIVASASFLAFFAGAGTPVQRARLLDTLTRLARDCRYLLPSLAPGSRTYDPMRYWRGPIWLVVSCMVAQGLAEAGETAWAERIRGDSRRLIEAAGFYESFSPETGAGTGGADFSWTAAMWLHWCGR